MIQMESKLLCRLIGPNARARIRVQPGKVIMARLAGGAESALPIGPGAYEVDSGWCKPGHGEVIFPVEVWEMDPARAAWEAHVYRGLRPLLRQMWGEIRARYPDRSFDEVAGPLIDVLGCEESARRMGFANHPDAQFRRLTPEVFGRAVTRCFAELRREEVPP